MEGFNPVWIALIAGLPGIIAAIFAGIIAMRLPKIVTAAVAPVAENVQKIETATNSALAKLLKTTGESEHAKGVISGAADERVRGEEKAVAVKEAAAVVLDKIFTPPAIPQ